jgi:sugar/nucleoside kinase (ribokinase family)
MPNRNQIACAAADALERAQTLPPALVGFDGFIDSIIDVVDQRRDMTSSGYTRIASIPAFAARVASAAGKSANLELVVKEERFGGNGPLMAGALGAAGCATTYVGAVGRPDAPTELHPIYRPFASLCRRVVPVAPPSTTDALEFEDGKLMLGQPANVQRVTWERLLEVVGEAELKRLIGTSAIIGIVNWTMMGGVEGIWRGLIEDVLPALAPMSNRRVFIDLADPAKRRREDIAHALSMLREMDRLVPVTLGLNLAEAEQIAGVLGVARLRDQGARSSAIEAMANDIRGASDLSCVVIHPREGAAASLRARTGGSESAWFDGPFVRNPRLSTGAGDHFNAGFALGLSLGLDLASALALGCATSGAYVRDAESPSRARLVEFLRDLPGPEGG